jgi:hypothetical protein
MTPACLRRGALAWRQGVSLILMQPCLGPHEIRGVKTPAERSVNLVELRAILVGALAELVQVVDYSGKV